MSQEITFLGGPQLSGGAQLGDWVCVEGECTMGKALIREMGVTYTSLVAQVPDNAAFVSRFSEPVRTIQATLESVDTWATRWVPFHTGCCTILELGRRAQTLTTEMRKWAGTADPDPTNVDPDKGLANTLVTLIRWTLTTAVIGGAAFGVYYGVKTLRATAGK